MSPAYKVHLCRGIQKIPQGAKEGKEWPLGLVLTDIKRDGNSIAGDADLGIVGEGEIVP